MGDDWDEEVADVTAAAPASGFVEVASADVPEIKLFGKWSCDEVNVSDMSLQEKAQCPVVERLVNSLMMHGRNNGKKLMTVRIVKHSFEIIHLLSGEVSCRILH